MLRKALLVAVLLTGCALIIIAQFSIPTLFGADGYLHIRMAEFMRDLGVDYDFHWARFSVFAEHFSDKDFLYHLAIIPFTLFENIFFGAKLAAAFGAIALFLTFFFVIRRYALPFLVPVSLSIFFLSCAFLQAISRPRPMVLMILLTIVFIHCAIGRRFKALFFLSLAYAFMHVSSPLLILFILLIEGVRWASEGQFDRRNAAGVALGVAAGFILHPHFPNNLLVFYLNGILVPLFALKWGLELGAEFFPMDTREFVLGYPWIFIGMFIFGIAAASKGMKARTSTRIWLAIAAFFFAGGFFSKRYIIHSYPVMVIAMTAYLTDWWESEERLVVMRRWKGARWAGIILLIAALGFSGRSTYRQFQVVRQSESIYNGHYEQVGRWMNDYVPAGETVFHANWSDSQFFIGLSPQHDYFVTLDPIYMYYWNPEKYRLYRDIAFGRDPDPYRSLREVFNVRYGYAGKNYFNALVEQIRGDSRFAIVAENQLGAFFKLN